MDIWYILTLLGEPLLWAVIAAVLALSYLLVRVKSPKEKRQRFKKFIVLLIISLALVFTITTALKDALQVQRPCAPCWPDRCDNPYCPADPGDYSFPSGHAATIFAVFSAAFLALRKKKYIVLFIVPILVSYSRFALGVHTPADVVGGAALGVIVTVLVWKAVNRL